MILPDFLMIGAAKSGSTSIFHYLDQHPEIYMCPLKDANFFAIKNEGTRLKFNGPSARKKGYAKGVFTLEEYSEKFNDVNGQKAIGESSNLYLYLGESANRIKTYIPDAKLIAVLRQPVDRAYSNFLHTINLGVEPLDDFTQAVKEEDERVKADWHPFFHYMRGSHYSALLRPYFDSFDRSQIKIYLFDDLRDNPMGMMQDMFEFLGVDSTFEPDLSLRFMATGMPKNKLLHNLITRPNVIKAALRGILPNGIQRSVRTQMKTRIKNKNLVKTRLSPELRDEFTEVFREDILELQDLIQRDLTHWLSKVKAK